MPDAAESRSGAVLVIVPALNEAGSIDEVVRTAIAVLKCDVLVVDDGSTDGTAFIANNAGAFVLSHPFNLGVGAALRSGFRFAVARSYEAVVQLDGDGQHDVAAAARLLERVIDGGADIAVGSRFEAGYRTGRLRRLTMRWLARIVSRRVHVAMTDTTSGFRAFSQQAVRRFASSYPTAYLSDTVEALLLAADYQFVVVEEPVRMTPRVAGRPSAGSLKSAFHMVRLGLVILLHRVRRPPTQRGVVFDVEA